MSIFESKKLRLIVKSPIHIGSVEQKITRFEFIHQGQYIYPISEDRLSVFLQRKNLIPSYIRAIEIEGPRFNLAEFFKGQNLRLTADELETISNKRKIKVTGDATKMQEFKPFIRDGFGLPYIPGTSIKGVIKTAILYNVLKKLKNDEPQEFKNTIEQKISRDIDFDIRRQNKKRLFNWGNERWFENFILGNKSKSPNTDWLRMLHVTDAYPMDNIQTILTPVNILKKENGWKYKEDSPGRKTNIWIECIPENTVFEFEATWDKSLFEDFKRHNRNLQLPDNLKAVIDNIDAWSKDIFEFEQQFSSGNSLENWYKNNKANFRIGFGSGMVSTTIAILLDENLRKKVRNYAGLNRGNDIAPKSRRVWSNNSNLLPFGWAVVEVV